MTSLLAGIDWSSKAIHAALIPLDTDHGDPSCPPVVFRHAELPKLNGDPITRIRATGKAIRELTRSEWPGTREQEVVSVWIEEAWGNHRNTDRALLPIYGALIASIPPHIAVAGISAREWRKELRLPLDMTKYQALAEAALRLTITIPNWPQTTNAAGVDHHGAEAYLVALAGRQINTRAFAA